MRRVLLFLLFFCALGYGAWRWRRVGTSHWENLGNGLEVRRYQVLSGGSRIAIIAFRVPASHVHLAGKDLLFAESWRVKAKARVAVNGGYFDTAYKAIGLRMARGRVLSPPAASNWPVFWICKGTPHIGPVADWSAGGRASDAVQCGPRLVWDGQVQPVKAQWARRTGIGIDARGRVVVAIAEEPMLFSDWAGAWADSNGLNCRDAMNLDGGGSTQMSVDAGGQRETLEGLWPVPDSVVIR